MTESELYKACDELVHDLKIECTYPEDHHEAVSTLEAFGRKLLDAALDRAILHIKAIAETGAKRNITIDAQDCVDLIEQLKRVIGR